MQSEPITTDIVSSNLAQVFDTILCDKVRQWLATDRLFSPGTLVFSSNKTDPYDININIVESGVKHDNPSPIA
jgi:hypothetical protein